MGSNETVKSDSAGLHRPAYTSLPLKLQLLVDHTVTKVVIFRIAGNCVERSGASVLAWTLCGLAERDTMGS
jgi:hypothetical protein